MLDEDPGFRNEILEMIEADAIDWQRFVALCSNHVILPAIYLKFQSHGIIDFLPLELAEFLKEIYDLNRSRNDQILEQLKEITEVLNKSDIHPVFLKGAAHLLDDLYSDIGERILGDIDILVPEKDYLPSVKLLENDGYSCFKDSIKYFNVENLKHYPALSKPGYPTHLEIHRLLIDENYRWFNPSITDKEKKTVNTLKGCFVLSDRHQIIHNFVHAQLHHGGHINGIVSFRDIYDLYLLSKRSAITETLPLIKCRQKAVAYFVFAGKVFGLNERFYPKSNFSAWFFLKRHNLNLNSPTFYHINRSIVYITQRVLIGHTAQVVKSFYSKSVRQSVINRLTDRQWYVAHFRSYIDFFKIKK